MASMNGLYRMAEGSKIVRSTYDFETQRIGPYTCPVKIPYDTKRCTSSSLAWWRLYKELCERHEALAVFNMNNEMIVVLEKDRVYQQHYLGENTKYQALCWYEPLGGYVELMHIGYVKTYPEQQTIFEQPYKLYMNADGYTVGLSKEIKLDYEPMPNPPAVLYKMLRDSEYEAVTMNNLDGKFIFL